MLPPNIAQDFKNAFLGMIETFGAAFVLEKPAGGVYQLIAFYADITKQDQELINAVGIGARILHTGKQAFEIAVLDQVIAPDLKRYTIHSALPVFINQELIGYRLIVGG